MAKKVKKPTAFGLALKKIREDKGWSQEELAEKLGIAPTTVSHFETGHRSWPSVPSLLHFADALPVSILGLLGRAPQR